MNGPDWHIQCDAAVFERIKGEPNFQQILALSRAVNSLQFVIDAFVPDAQEVSSKAWRGRINSFLFGSAILYEGLLLVEKMNQQFGDNEIFRKGLYTLLKDPAARALRKSHMGPVRNFAVFHYDSEEFGKIVRSAGVHECAFMVGRGASGRESYFPLADEIATELLMGRAGSDEDFYEHLAAVIGSTKQLTIRFIEFSHTLILKCLKDWRFIPTLSGPNAK
jgi:hypothetical protein